MLTIDMNVVYSLYTLPSQPAAIVNSKISLARTAGFIGKNLPGSLARTAGFIGKNLLGSLVRTCNVATDRLGYRDVHGLSAIDPCPKVWI